MDEDELDWSVDEVDAEHVWGGAEVAVDIQQELPTGAGIKIAFLDSGNADHSDLSFSRANCESFVSYTESTDDDNGHGTGIVGMINAQDTGRGVQV